MTYETELYFELFKRGSLIIDNDDLISLIELLDENKTEWIFERLDKDINMITINPSN